MAKFTPGAKRAIKHYFGSHKLPAAAIKKFDYPKAGDSGHWATINGHHVFIQSGGPGAAKGGVTNTPHSPTGAPPSSKTMASGHPKHVPYAQNPKQQGNFPVSSLGGEKQAALKHLQKYGLSKPIPKYVKSARTGKPVWNTVADIMASWSEK